MSRERHVTLGEADEQVGQCEGAGKSAYRSSDVMALAGFAAYPVALGGTVREPNERILGIPVELMATHD
jgi:hypothetical protein